jgi:predicted HAD superfamily Cof-like phosphohydrolase
MAILQKLSTEKLNYQNAIVLDTDGTTDFEKVGEFHEKFKFPVSDGSCELPATEHLLFRLQFLQEELMELTQGIRFRDPVQIADALADLVYVAHGTAHWCNLPWDEIFAEVHRSNMQKERVAKASDSKRADEFDCVKPVWWQPPNLKAIVEKHQVDARV